MTNKEQEYWEKFREKYGDKFKRITATYTGGVYATVKADDVVTFDDSDKVFLIGDVAEYIYDLEDIKEESLIIFKQYNNLLKKYNKLKEEKSAKD